MAVEGGGNRSVSEVLQAHLGGREPVGVSAGQAGLARREKVEPQGLLGRLEAAGLQETRERG